MRFKTDSHIYSLMVVGSSVCNLNCSYCYLENQHKTNAYVLLNKEIQKAWNDGSYVENIKKVFKTIESNPEYVTDLEIWGGEPLIIANNLLTPIEELITYFSNIKYVNIPTNFTRINYLDELILKINDTKSKVKPDEKVYIHLQISLDAPDGEAQQFGHPVKWEIYRNNVENLCLKLSKINNLNNVMVGIEWHSTMSLPTILKYLDTYDKIFNYCDEFNKLHLFIQDTINKYNLSPIIFQESETSFPHNATPQDITIEESNKLEQILYLTKYLGSQRSYKTEKNKHSYIYTKNSANVGNLSLLRTNPVCLESGVHGITVMYDGSICECPCDYILNFDGYWDWIKDDPIRRKNYRSSMYKKQYYINPLTASEEEKDDFDWYIFESCRMNISTSLHLMMNFYLELAKSGHIDNSYYKDPASLLKDLTQFNQSYSCPKDQLETTYTSYMGGVGAAKLYFNGIAKMAQRDYKSNLQFEIKGKTKWNVQKW